MHPPTADDHSLRRACIRETSRVRLVPADPLKGTAPPTEDSQPHLNRDENPSPRACSLLNHSKPPAPANALCGAVDQPTVLKRLDPGLSHPGLKHAGARDTQETPAREGNPHQHLRPVFSSQHFFEPVLPDPVPQNHVRTLCFQCFRTDPMKNGKRRVATRRIRSTLRTSTGPKPHHSDRLRTNHPREPKLNPRSPDAPRKTGEGRSTEAHA